MSRIVDETADETSVQIEYVATPRKRHCTECIGEGCSVCHGSGVMMPPFRPFDRDAVVKPGRISRDAAYVITIDDAPYAGFDSWDAATGALKLWTGHADGLGRPVDHWRRVHWPAVEGRAVRVERMEDVRRRGWPL